MKTKNLFYCSIAVATLLITGCKKNYESSSNKNSLMETMSDGDVTYAEEGEPMVLGAQRQNAYTLTNMQAAKDSLDVLGYVSENEVNIRVTHKYIKFAPANEEELNELWQDTTITFYDYPMDYYISVYGNFYHDPEIPDSLPTYQYASVKVGHSYNTSIAHEIVADLYIPEEDVQLIGADQDENIFYMLNLYSMAQTLSFNFDMPVFETITPWDPVLGQGGGHVLVTISGIIRVNDTRLNQDIPLQGVRVTSKKNFTTHEGYTNANGAYTLNGAHTNTNNVTHTIWFRDNDHLFRIQRNKIENAKIVRHNNSNFWSHTIVDGRDRMHGHMFRAAYRYFHGNIDGLRRPTRPGNVAQLLMSHDGVKNWSGINYYLTTFLKVARFSSFNNNREFLSDEIFGITIHELAHTAHVFTMNAGPLQYSQVDNIICESWAIACQWHITNMEYEERGELGYGQWDYNPAGFLRRPHRRAFQYWGTVIDNDSDYTSLFINIVDNYNEFGQPVWGVINGVVDDQVSGYTLANIQANMLGSIYGIATLSTELKANLPNGITNAQIDLLLSHY